MKRLFALSLFFLFLACSGDNGTAPKDPGGGGGGGGGGGTVTSEDTLRVNALNEIAQHLDGWWADGPDSVAARQLHI
jgi:hypothetical protein